MIPSNYNFSGSAIHLYDTMEVAAQVLPVPEVAPEFSTLLLVMFFDRAKWSFCSVREFRFLSRETIGVRTCPVCSCACFHAGRFMLACLLQDAVRRLCEECGVNVENIRFATSPVYRDALELRNFTSYDMLCFRASTVPSQRQVGWALPAGGAR